jgi:hypothetical protein
MEQGSASMEHDGGAQNLKNGRNRGAQIADPEGYRKVSRHVFFIHPAHR